LYISVSFIVTGHEQASKATLGHDWGDLSYWEGILCIAAQLAFYVVLKQILPVGGIKEKIIAVSSHILC